MLQLFALAERLKRPIWRFGSLPLVWLMVVMSYAYGHAFAAQARFEQGRLSRIVGAVSALQVRDLGQPVRYLMVNGTMPRSPVLRNTVRKFPLIDRLIPPLLEGDQTFSYQQLELHGLGLEKRNLDGMENVLPASCQPSVEAICTSEFSLHLFSPDTLYLELPPDQAPARPRT